MIFCPYFTDSLVALTVRLVAPGHLVIPLMRAAAIAVDSEGAASGWGGNFAASSLLPRLGGQRRGPSLFGLAGVISNTAGWLFQPCVDLAQGYWNAPTRLRSLRGWWNNGEGRHFLRIWVS